MSTAAANLSNASINLEVIKSTAATDLTKILDRFKGKKALVLDAALSGPLSLVAGVKIMRQHGVTDFFLLSNGPLQTPANAVIYLIRPNIELAKRIVDQIKAYKRDPRSHRIEFGVFCVPRSTEPVDRILEEADELVTLERGELPLDFIPFERDTLSMEIPNAFKDCFVDGDPTVLTDIARALVRLQARVGVFPLVKGKGTAAHKVVQAMHRMRQEQGPAYFGFNMPEIEQVILLDRTVDLVTPMLTQFTYEGMLDEVFRIKNASMDVDSEPGAEKPTKKIQLNSSDSLFDEIRDLNFRVLGTLLHRKAEFIKETYAARHAAQSVQEMASFLKKFKSAHAEHTLLQTHINIADKISQRTKTKKFDRRLDIERMMLECTDQNACEDYVEEAIAKMEPFPVVCRLLTLLATTVGLSKKKVDHFKREILHTYGFEQLLTLVNMEKLGVLSKNARKGDWPKVRRSLRLQVPADKMDLHNPTDYHFVCSGYAPLSIRLVEIAVQPGGWKKHEEVLSQIPGRAFEYKQDLPSSILERAPRYPGYDQATHISAAVETTASSSSTSTSASTSTSSSSSLLGPEGKLDGATEGGEAPRKPTTLVVFIGGVTFSEIAAIRHLSERESHGRDYLIATTKLVNGTSLMETIEEPLVNRLEKRSMGGM